MIDTYESEDGTFELVVVDQRDLQTPMDAWSNEKDEGGHWVYRTYTRVEEQEAA